MKAIKARRMWIGYDDKDCIVAVGRSQGEVLSQGHVWRVAREAVLPADPESAERAIEQGTDALRYEADNNGYAGLTTEQRYECEARVVLKSLGLAGRGK